MTQAQVVMKNLTIKKGQEYRAYDTQYKDSVKYLWLTAKDKSDIKIYGQRKPVTYADYKPGMLYAMETSISRLRCSFPASTRNCSR